MVIPSLVLGYHGCDRATAEKVLRNRACVSCSKNPHDWLGNGAYFWENSSHRAMLWAIHVRDHPQHFKHEIKDPCVIGAIMDLGNCLDLTDSESLEVVKNAHEQLSQIYALTKIEMPKNEEGFKGDGDLVKRNLDCAVINAVHLFREKKAIPFDSVRGIFTEGKPLYPGGKIQAKTHVQICVRNVRKSIRGYFLPPGSKL